MLPIRAQVAKTTQVGTLNGKTYYLHIVQPGQTVYSITRAYGLKEHEAVLKSDIHHLAVGDTVWIPCTDCKPGTQVSYQRFENEPGTPVSHSRFEYQYIKVEAGQTLYSLSRAYNVSIEDLNELNPELKTSGLKAGQTIKVPGNASGKQESHPQSAVSEAKGHAPLSAVGNQPAAKSPRQPAVYVPKPPSEPARISPPIEQGKVHVSLLMPLHLADIDKISTTKFDVDQRGKKSYNAFEYIQFYEGICMGLDRLERTGVRVVLNVVDVSGKTKQDLLTAVSTHNVSHSDFVIAMLPREQFEYAADWAQENGIFIVNPLSERDEIVEGNPYVFKCMPSVEGRVDELLRVICSMPGTPHLYIINSGSRNEARSRSVLEEKLKSRGNIKYTLFDWSANSKLVATLKKTPGCVVLNIYDQNRDKNRIQVSTLLNRLAALKGGATLVSLDNYMNLYGDIDFAQLQQSGYMTVNSELDYNDPAKKDFIDAFNARYKTDPLSYAAMANDIILYFAYGLKNRGTDFWRSPNQTGIPGILCPLVFTQSDRGHGFVNGSATYYKLSNLKFIPVKSNQQSAVGSR